MEIQSLPNKMKVQFDHHNIVNAFEGISIQEVIDHQYEWASIVNLQTYTKLGDQNCEYYDIRFEDGTVWSGISGYHLEWEVKNNFLVRNESGFNWFSTSDEAEKFESEFGGIRTRESFF